MFSGLFLIEFQSPLHSERFQLGSAKRKHPVPNQLVCGKPSLTDVRGRVVPHDFLEKACV